MGDFSVMTHWKRVTKTDRTGLEYETYVCADDCADRRIVKKTDSIGRVFYTEQCKTCGHNGTMLSKKTVDEHIANGVLVEHFDEQIVANASHELGALQAAQAEQRRDEFSAKIKKEKEDRRAFYDEYIKSDKWKKKRDAILRRDNYTCKGCLCRRAQHVHHLTYAHLGDELAYELISVCVSCHEKEHPHMQSEAAE